MKEKEICMYLIFWFKGEAPNDYKKLPSYGCAKTGDEYICMANVELKDKRYVDFDEVLKEFLKKCKESYDFIKKMVDSIPGVFNVEIVPSFTAYSSVPSIVLDRNFIEFVVSLGNKFGCVDIDSYII